MKHSSFPTGSNHYSEGMNSYTSMQRLGAYSRIWRLFWSRWSILRFPPATKTPSNVLAGSTSNSGNHTVFEQYLEPEAGAVHPSAAFTQRLLVFGHGRVRNE